MKKGPREPLIKKSREPISVETSFELSHVEWLKKDNDQKTLIAPYQKVIQNSHVSYIVNDSGFRCDDFTSYHVGKHVLFAGCSVTFGQGLDLKDVWAYRIYQKINGLSGYFNLSFPGASITDIINNVIKYCRKFGNPEVIFLCLPNIERDYKYTVREEKMVKKIVFEYYLMLDQYCMSNNIKLFTFSWAHGVFKNEEHIIDEFLGNYFDSYYNSDVKKFKNDLFLFSNEETNLFAVDNIHPGAAAHFAWYNFIYEKYENKIHN